MDALIIERLRKNAERAKHKFEAADAPERAEALWRWNIARDALAEALASVTQISRNTPIGPGRFREGMIGNAASGLLMPHRSNVQNGSRTHLLFGSEYGSAFVQPASGHAHKNCSLTFVTTMYRRSWFKPH
jgi:hypothetical protein